MSSKDRITIPVPPDGARDTEREFEAADSDIQPLVRLTAAPWLIMTYDEIQALPLDPRAAFVVSLIDGKCTVEMLLDISGMPEDETLATIGDLLRLGAIELRDAK